MRVNLTEVRKRTATAKEYIESLEQPFRQNFLNRKQTYQLDTEALNQLKRIAGKHVIIAFSALWCKDCASNIPVLALLSGAAGVEVRVFGGLKKDPLNPRRKWRIPPSPPEVEAYKIEKLPTIIVVDAEGWEKGRIVEKPTRMPALEQEICEIIKSQQ
jgi:thiol-disulfide isomerase/thioredoxin